MMKRHSGKRLAADLVPRPELQSSEGRRAGWAALRSIPGWLASILLHLAVLLVLAHLGQIESGTHKRIETRAAEWSPAAKLPRAGRVAAEAGSVAARAKEA